MPRSLLSGRRRVVGSSHRLSEVERTTVPCFALSGSHSLRSCPAAPTKEPSVHFCWWRGHPSFAKEESLPPVFRALLMGNDQLKTCNMDRLLQVWRLTTGKIDVVSGGAKTPPLVLGRSEPEACGYAPTVEQENRGPSQRGGAFAQAVRCLGRGNNRDNP